jgi:hypothetical protein
LGAEFPKVLAAEIIEYTQINQAIPAICKLTLLKYALTEHSLLDRYLGYFREYAAELLESDIYFAFFKDLADEICEIGEIAEQQVIEYSADVPGEVFLHYAFYEPGQKNIVFKIEKMKKVYQGFYALRFTMFDGEQLRYYITGSSQKVFVADKVITQECKAGSDGSMYGQINEMIKLSNAGNKTLLNQRIEEFECARFVADGLFKLV